MDHQRLCMPYITLKVIHIYTYHTLIMFDVLKKTLCYWVTVTVRFIYIGISTVALKFIYIDISKILTARSLINYFRWEWCCCNFAKFFKFWNIISKKFFFFLFLPTKSQSPLHWSLLIYQLSSKFYMYWYITVWYLMNLSIFFC